MTDPNANSAPKGNVKPVYKRRVRNILIHKPMQREFIFVMIALLMVSTLAVSFVIHNTIHEAANGGGFRFGKVSAYEVLSDVSYDLAVRVAAILFVTLVVICIFGIFFLFRVAGPVYRFRQVLLRINDGEIPPPVKLREGDFFSETATEINRLLKHHEFEKRRNELLRTKLDQILASHPSDPVGKSVKELKLALETEPEES